MKIGHFKMCAFTSCDKMLDFVNLKHGGTCVHGVILAVMLRCLLNRLVNELTSISVYLGI